MSSTMSSAPRLDLGADVVTVTSALCDIESVSGNEQQIADAIEAVLRPLSHLEVTRDGHTIIARTNLGRTERVVLAGHIDTVPLTDPPNLPARREGDNLVGRGTCDMKGGVAVQLRLASALSEPTRDITYVFYDCEEVEDERNGLARVGRNSPELLASRLRRAARAHRRCRRGRLQRDPARRGHGQRQGGALGAALERSQRDPRGGDHPGPVGGL